eukprot:CAMPEP_0175153968 /NCGR_PEP_ID=MMETSP0087-20121206/20053_1 /TAXON_ID=136419 /ORGANISM="Unknown Unknown, Strain D1" /LENGTH=143 /DNA_ID=CAMNT_0016440749 /DNA_START=32 /DNA_END=460 /DNA_ORIENTATION=-
MRSLREQAEECSVNNCISCTEVQWRDHVGREVCQGFSLAARCSDVGTIDFQWCNAEEEQDSNGSSSGKAAAGKQWEIKELGYGVRDGNCVAVTGCEARLGGGVRLFKSLTGCRSACLCQELRDVGFMGLGSSFSSSSSSSSSS